MTGWIALAGAPPAEAYRAEPLAELRQAGTTRR